MLARKSSNVKILDYILKLEDPNLAYSLSSNKYISLTEEYIAKNKNNFDWFYLSGKKYLPWSIELITSYFDLWDWEQLSENEGI